MSSLVLWLSLVGYEDELVLLKKMSIDELGGVARAAFPHVGASSLYFHANKEQISDDGRLSKLANNSNIIVTYNAVLRGRAPQTNSLGSGYLCSTVPG